MKYLFTCLLILSVFACQKESNTSYKNTNVFLTRVFRTLKDSLTGSRYAEIDYNAVYASFDIDSSSRFVRIGFSNKDYESDFILLKTDESGVLISGKIIHADLYREKGILKDYKLRISSLNERAFFVFSGSTLKSASKSKLPDNTDDQPVGEQILPPVIVTTTIYNNSGGSTGNTSTSGTGSNSGGITGNGSGNSYGNISGGGAGNGTGSSSTGGTVLYSYDYLVFSTPFSHSYLYGLSKINHGGNIHTGNTNDLPAGKKDTPDKKDDKTFIIEFENGNPPEINLNMYLKCFDNVSDQGATYKITIYADIPINGDASTFFDYHTMAVGHTFIQLEKKSGSNSIQQNIGFYPKSGYKSVLAYTPVDSKFVDNGGHEYNASLSIYVTKENFSKVISKMKNLSQEKYDIDEFNCTEYALQVFNSVAPKPINIPKYSIPGHALGVVTSTPQGLFKELVALKNSGYSGAEIKVPTSFGNASASHGPCN